MSLRMNIFGKGQGLDGDKTSTGATCIANQARGFNEGRRWLLEGDKTTPCPSCGEEGTIIDGESRWRQDGLPAVVDGTQVQCGCPPGNNYVLAPLEQRATPQTGAIPRPASSALRSQSPLQPRQNFSGATSTKVWATPGGLEPGFHIVRSSTSFPQLLMQLFEKHGALPVARLQRLNPTFAQGFKAGEIFVIGDPDNGYTCTREEAELMAAAERARAALGDLTREEANFMMRYQAEIAGLLSDVSLAMGVSQAMMAKSLNELKSTLLHIEKLHQAQFTTHGNLTSQAFFAERKKLFKELDAKLRTSFLNKQLNLGSYDTLRRDLRISSKSLIHHWSKAGVAGQIPGYATHLDKLASMSKYLQAGGRVGVVLGGAGSFLKIREACTAGDDVACKKIKFTESGSFAGGLAGGATGGAVGRAVAGFACIGLGPASAACSIVVTGVSALGTSVAGMSGGEQIGEELYEFIERH